LKVAATTAAGATAGAEVTAPATATASDVADLSALPDLLPENETSRLYLRLIERWIPTGLSFYEAWDKRPHTGHFFGGAYWYGMETAWSAEAFACAAIAPDYDEAGVGVPREDLIRMAVSGIRYLAFTHDVGPADCVRPSPPHANERNAGTKWGERGRGYFPESQCTWAIAPMTRMAVLLREHMDEETLALVARVVDDYARRFDETAPWEGVYHNTQTEENGWTAWGLASAATFLGQHERAEHWMNAVKRWSVCIATTPQDSHNLGSIAGTPIKDYCRRHVTTLPDFWAENHDMVHPTYTATGVVFAAQIAAQLKLYGHDIPDEVMWNRKEVYANLRAVVDDYGYFLPVQGMDWDYLPGMLEDTSHSFASVFLNDSVGAALMRRNLKQAEMRLESFNGRFYNPKISERAHDIQDPMFMREIAINHASWGYQFHRLFGPGVAPAPDDEVERSMQRAQVWTHAGSAHNRHLKGQTSFSWRNSIMALSTTREGITLIGPASGSFLGQPAVAERPESHDLVSIEVDRTERSFTAAMVMDRAQKSLRQQVLFASLPDGRTISFERFIALEDVTIEKLHQGEQVIINEDYPAYPDGNCRGERILHGPDGNRTYEGWLGDSEEDDELVQLGRPAWLNVDDRIGYVFQGSGDAQYLNRHYHRPFHAVHDRLMLSVVPTGARVAAGDSVGWLATIILPQQQHEETAKEPLHVLDAGDDTAAVVTRGVLAVANFSERDRDITFTLQGDKAPAFPGVRATIEGRNIAYTVRMPAGRAGTYQAVEELAVTGSAEVRADEDGTVFVTNTTADAITVQGNAGTPAAIASGQTIVV
jgi:hypothetical protein